MTTSMRDIRDLDLRHLWHPYTDILRSETQEAYTLIERAEGVYLYEQGGRRLLDGIASWWCVNLGHSHPKLVHAIQEQAARLQHCILGGISHEPAVRLAEQISRLTPGDLDHVFFCGDGSSAVEAAIKIAIQYWHNKGESGRHLLVGLEDGYHGDTLGAISVGYVDEFHRPFKLVLMDSRRAVSPHCNRCPMGKTPDSCSIECFDSMETIIRRHRQEIAAVIIEPVCQGAGGIRIFPDEYLKKLRRLCDEHHIPLICDEIAVGFGRTGYMFASERAGIVPDIMTIGKGLTGGYLPLSAAVVRTAIYDSFRNDPGKPGAGNRTFFHGHTFAGNPITCACALAAVEVYRETCILEKMRPLVQQMKQGFNRIGELLPGSKTLSTGLIGMLEIFPGDGGVARAMKIAGRAGMKGLYIRPLGPVLYLWPPLVTTPGELDEMIDIFMDAVRETSD
jgi:adenosylmethionine-8-amino-7-oxononanoate aminotransferase